MVKSTKHVFNAILGHLRLTEVVLLTALCLVEQCLNARPFVPASEDATDHNALKPSHFLLGRPSVALSASLVKDTIKPRNAFASSQAYVDAIWQRWIRKYVPTLNARSKWKTQD